MATKSRKPRADTEFTVPVKVQVRHPEFVPLATLASLDVDRLSRGSHKIEIGFMEGGCCRNLVRAVIRGGMVVGIEVEPCEETRGGKASPEVMKLFEQARRRLKVGGKWKPFPVSYLASRQRQRDLVIIIGGGCIFICIFDFCFMCCWYPRPHCFRPVIIEGPL